MSRRKQKRSEVLIFKTFEIQWINHPQFGNSFQYVAEDLLYEDITVDLESSETPAIDWYSEIFGSGDHAHIPLYKVNHRIGIV